MYHVPHPFFSVTLLPGRHEIVALSRAVLLLYSASPQPKAWMQHPWTETSETVSQNKSCLSCVVYVRYFIAGMKSLTNEG
jgi:hypothetical protein